VAGRILKRIEALTHDPPPPGCRKLERTDTLWRIRVGDWRVVYAVDDVRLQVEVSLIRHRREVYR
jgi:mRNA interferase RelE/StbE